MAANESRLAQARALQQAIFGLQTTWPAFSASVVITPAQRAVLIAVATACVAAFIFWPQVLIAWMSFGFVAGLAFRVALACRGRSRAASVACALQDEALPVYSVLVPLYREAEVLPRLEGHLRALDYPAEKLDVKLVVEEDDGETRRLAENTSRFEVVAVPAGLPRTKPKACNYALQFARGEFVVIYDAEDLPEPDQLRKAVASFRIHPDVTCLQARLSIDNGSGGWLPCMFALDYGIWFRTLLPGLDRLHAPIPLGGTSNHFRIEHLRAAGAWDPFNVTEDADLGIRLARLGHRVAMLDSATFEEAPLRLGFWLRQRTRWMKGYMQTLLVHTRHPLELVRTIGLGGCLAVESFLGGAVWSSLVNPLLWAEFAISCVAGVPHHSLLNLIAVIAGGAVLIGNLLLAALSLVDARQPWRWSALFQAITYPIYWLLISVAAYRALWQLMTDPFRWEKTPHGAANR